MHSEYIKKVNSTLEAHIQFPSFDGTNFKTEKPS